MDYEKLYQEQLRANEELKQSLAQSMIQNQKLRADLEKLSIHVDEEVVRRTKVTKERISEMIKLIDSVIETEQQGIKGWLRRLQ